MSNFVKHFEKTNWLYIPWLPVFIVKWTMIGSRTRIVLLTSFFTFAFAMLFLALVENYAHAWTTILPPPARVMTVINTADIQPAIEHEIIPDFWQEKHTAPWFDFDSDDSFQKFLRDDHPFEDDTYTPADLLPIDSNFTANNSKTFKLRFEAGIQFADMARHFWNAFSGDKLYIVSTYRSRSLQEYLISKWCALLRCAKTGTSEHQAWLALDLKVITRWWKWYSLDVTYPNKYYDRLKANAADYWFHNTYQKWVEVDGKMAEWRHRRYMWTALAKILADNNQTFAEYYIALDK